MNTLDAEGCSSVSRGWSIRFEGVRFGAWLFRPFIVSAPRSTTTKANGAPNSEEGRANGAILLDRAGFEQLTISKDGCDVEQLVAFDEFGRRIRSNSPDMTTVASEASVMFGNVRRKGVTENSLVATLRTEGRPSHAATRRVTRAVPVTCRHQAGCSKERTDLRQIEPSGPDLAGPPDVSSDCFTRGEVDAKREEPVLAAN